MNGLWTELAARIGWSFADPLLLLLALLALPVWRLGADRPRRRGPVALLPTVSPEGLPVTPRRRFAAAPLLLRCVVILLLAAALARPSREEATRIPGTTDSVDIMLALDLSESMQVRDFAHDGRRLNRLEAAQLVLEDFIARRPHDRIGLVIFGETAYSQCPVTLDHDWLLRIIRRLEPGGPVSGRKTAIGTALGLAGLRLRESPALSRVVVLLTDGENNTGVDPMRAAEALRSDGVQVYIVGAGSEEVREVAPGRYYAGLNTEALSALAEAADGSFYRADNMERLREVYAEIDAMERTEVEGLRLAGREDYYPFILIQAIALLAVEQILAATWLRRTP
jgi:Ca-activated chloride channel family protein